jgi:hypothetical protein
MAADPDDIIDTLTIGLRFLAPEPLPAFNDKWIIVAGTWDASLTDSQSAIAADVGTALAEQGYGLMTGDGRGVDAAVSVAFANRLGIHGKEVDERLRMVLLPGQSTTHNYGIKVEKANNEEWFNYCFTEARALIMIGGTGGTYNLFEQAHLHGIPAIPVPDTGGDAEKAQSFLTENERQFLQEATKPDYGPEPDWPFPDSNIALAIVNRLGTLIDAPLKPPPGYSSSADPRDLLQS